MGFLTSFIFSCDNLVFFSFVFCGKINKIEKKKEKKKKVRQGAPLSFSYGSPRWFSNTCHWSVLDSPHGFVFIKNFSTHH